MAETPTHQLFYNPLTLQYRIVSITRALQQRANGWIRLTWGTEEELKALKIRLELQKIAI